MLCAVPLSFASHSACRIGVVSHHKQGTCVHLHRNLGALCELHREVKRLGLQGFGLRVGG